MARERPDKTVPRLLEREKALAAFGSFAFRAPELPAILDEAARICAISLDTPFSKICKFQPASESLLIVAGCGWKPGVVGYGISLANETSPQGLAFVTGQPQVCPDIAVANTFTLPEFYSDHNILSTADVIIAAKLGPPFGVLEVDSQRRQAFDQDDIDFLTGFANILAEAVAAAARSHELQQTIARMERLVAEKDVLSKELKHRVRNSLHLVYGLLTAELDSRPADGSAFRAIAIRVMGLAEVFEHLLGTGMEKTINFGDYIAELCRQLPGLYDEEHITLVCDSEPCSLALDEATALGVVVTELINNAYQHAFPDGKGAIRVTVAMKSERLLLSVGDDGAGFTEIETKRHGVGLVRRLVDQIGGTLALTSGTGSLWVITLVPGGVLPVAA